MFTSFLFALISATSFGISNGYWKIPHKHISLTQLIFFRGIIASAIFGLLWISINIIHADYFETISYKATLSEYLFTILLCFVCSLGLVFFLQSIHYSKISITVPLTSINLFSILTAVFVLNEKFKTQFCLTFLFAFFGILLLQLKTMGRFSLQWNKGATYAILASFVWGVTYALFKFPVKWVGPIPLAFLLESSVTITALIWSLINKSKINFADLTNKKNIKHYLILAFLLVNGTLFFNMALRDMSVLILIFSGCFQMIVAVLFEVFVFKLKLKVSELIGILLIIISIIISYL